MKKKIIVMVTLNLSKWMYKSLYEEQIELKKELINKGYKVFFFGPGFKNCENLDFQDYKNKIIRENVDLFILYGGEKFFFNGLSDDELKFFNLKKDKKNYINQFKSYYSTKKVIHINDFWHNNKYEWKILFKSFGITDVFSMYAPFNVSKKKFKNHFIDRHIYFHKYNRAINLKNLSKIDKNLNHKRFYDVIMIGAVNKFYPFRLNADKSLSKIREINYKKFDHPGYKFFTKKNNNPTVGKNYYKVMENSKVVVTCGTILRLPIPKIWEIMSTGAILIIDKIENKKNLNLRKNINYIEANSINLVSKIKWILKNENLRKKIAKNAMISSRKKYSLQAQSIHLRKIVDKIILRKKTHNISFNIFDIICLKILSKIENFIIIQKKIYYKILRLFNFF